MTAHLLFFLKQRSKRGRTTAFSRYTVSSPNADFDSRRAAWYAAANFASPSIKRNRGWAWAERC